RKLFLQYSQVVGEQLASSHEVLQEPLRVLCALAVAHQILDVVLIRRVVHAEALGDARSEGIANNLIRRTHRRRGEEVPQRERYPLVLEQGDAVRALLGLPGGEIQRPQVAVDARTRLA